MATLRSMMESFLSGWRNDVDPEWQDLLEGVEPAFNKIEASLRTRADEVVLPGRKRTVPSGGPPGSHVFRAFDDIIPKNIRVVIIGQDPYPRVESATGRAFEQGDLPSWTAPQPKVAPSLKRIVQQTVHFRTGNETYIASGGWRRLIADLENGTISLQDPRELFEAWQSHGVLLLNTGLTLTRYKPGGHAHQLRGHIPLWAPVVGAVCSRLARRDDVPVVFLVWGKKAREFLAGIGVLESALRPVVVSSGMSLTEVVDRNHPAVYSFFNGQNVFEETNEKLSSIGGTPIRW